MPIGRSALSLPCPTKGEGHLRHCERSEAIQLSREPPWIASLALAMTSVLAALLRARGLPTTTPRKDSPPAKKREAERRKAQFIWSAQHRRKLPCAGASGAEARHRQFAPDGASHLLAGRARLPALRRGSRQDSYILAQLQAM